MMETCLLTAYVTLIVLHLVLCALFLVLLGLCAIVKILEYFLKKLADFKNRVPKA
jgi:hypothetical protein